MRKRKSNSKISVYAIAGTEVVLLGLNATEEAAEGLLGFTIYKRQDVAIIGAGRAGSGAAKAP